MIVKIKMFYFTSIDQAANIVVHELYNSCIMALIMGKIVFKIIEQTQYSWISDAGSAITCTSCRFSSWELRALLPVVIDSDQIDIAAKLPSRVTTTMNELL